jgi:hypothetical protein
MIIKQIGTEEYINLRKKATSRVKVSESGSVSVVEISGGRFVVAWIKDAAELNNLFYLLTFPVDPQMVEDVEACLRGMTNRAEELLPVTSVAEPAPSVAKIVWVTARGWIDILQCEEYTFKHYSIYKTPNSMWFEADGLVGHYSSITQQDVVAFFVRSGCDVPSCMTAYMEGSKWQ